MKRYEITVGHNKYCNGGMTRRFFKVEVLEKDEKAAVDKVLKERTSTKKNVYFVFNVKEI